MTYWIQRTDQLKALGSPLRQRMVDVVQSIGPCSISEIAEAVDRRADSLYHHMRILEAVGLVTDAGRRATERRPEALFDVPGRPMRMAIDADNIHHLRTLAENVGAMLRLTERNVQEALEQGDVLVGKRGERLRGMRVEAWLTKGELRQVLEHIDCVAGLMTGRERRGGERFAFSVVLTPLPPPGGED